MKISNGRTEHFCLPPSCSPKETHILHVNDGAEYFFDTNQVKTS